MSTVASAIDHIGLTRLAEEVGYYPSAVQKWRDESRLPRTELAGLTHYARTIEELTGGQYKAADLLAETRSAWERRIARVRPGKKRRNS